MDTWMTAGRIGHCPPRLGQTHRQLHFKLPPPRSSRRWWRVSAAGSLEVIYRASSQLYFTPTDIIPQSGPGSAVCLSSAMQPVCNQLLFLRGAGSHASQEEVWCHAAVTARSAVRFMWFMRASSRRKCSKPLQSKRGFVNGNYKMVKWRCKSGLVYILQKSQRSVRELVWIIN